MTVKQPAKAAAQQPNRIPEENAEAFNAWRLPEMDVHGNIIAAEKVPAPAPRANKAKPKTKAKTPVNAGEVVEDLDAADIVSKPITAEHLQQITETAEKEGFDKGYKEGLKQGIADGKDRGYTEGVQKSKQESDAILKQKVKALQQVSNQLMQPFKQQESQMHLLLLDFVGALTRKLVRRELQIDSGDILAVVKQGVQALPVGAKNLRLHLNPDDLALIEAYAEEKHLGWQFIGDSSLSAGGCRIESDESLVDYTVEIQLGELLEQFLTKQLAADVNLDPDQNPTPQLDAELLESAVAVAPDTAGSPVSDSSVSNRPSQGLGDTGGDDMPGSSAPLSGDDAS
jgi:flagellar assembly protein FliH